MLVIPAYLPVTTILRSELDVFSLAVTEAAETLNPEELPEKLVDVVTSASSLAVSVVVAIPFQYTVRLRCLLTDAVSLLVPPVAGSTDGCAVIFSELLVHSLQFPKV